jgi:prefoldin subunit 5
MRGGKPRMEELPAAMRELREENERLRAELNELRKK